MLKWSQLLQYQGLLDQLSHCYTFPIEVRQYLHEWLEEQPWHLLDPTNPSPEQEEKATEMLQTTIVKLRNKVLELNGSNFGLQRTRLEQAANQFEKQYRHNVRGFVQMMKQAFEKEALLLQTLLGQENMIMSMDQMSPSPLMNVSREQLITDKLQELQVAKQRMEVYSQRIQDNVELNNCWQQRRALTEQREKVQKSYSVQQGQLGVELSGSGSGGGEGGELHQQLLAQLQATQSFQQELETRAECMDAYFNTQLKLRGELSDLYKGTLPVLEQVLTLVVEDEMTAWKHSQQLGSNGSLPPDDSDLDRLQYWCESLAEVLVLMHQQTGRWSPLLPAPSDSSLAASLDFLGVWRGNVRCLLLSLVSSTLILERQPDQVVQQNSYFSATVRLLVARKLNLVAPFPKVKASILSEDEARQWKKDRGQVVGVVGVSAQRSSFILKNEEALMEFQKGSSPSQASGPLCAQFRMQLDSHRARARRGQERVTKIKFCFRFQTSLNFEGTPLDLQVLSLPVVVTVHGSQKCQAVATILWDNAFALPQREGFEVPSSVPWLQLAEQLQVKCEKWTGRRMTAHHLQFLADKLFGTQGCDQSNAVVTQAQFCERPLQEHGCKIREQKKGKRRCTFWDWFYDAVHLIEKRLKGLWEENHMEGFVSKMKAQEMLLTQEEGTFLFRFSDSECGALSIAFVEGKDGRRWVSHTNPVDLDNMNLADKIRGPNRLVTLYPDIPKDVALARYYTPEQEVDRRSSYLPFPYVTEKPSSSTEDYKPFCADAFSSLELPSELADLNMEHMQSLIGYAAASDQ